MISLCIANRNHISHIINRNNLILYMKNNENKENKENKKNDVNKNHKSKIKK